MFFFIFVDLKRILLLYIEFFIIFKYNVGNVSFYGLLIRNGECVRVDYDVWMNFFRWMIGEVV